MKEKVTTEPCCERGKEGRSTKASCLSAFTPSSACHPAGHLWNLWHVIAPGNKGWSYRTGVFTKKQTSRYQCHT